MIAARAAAAIRAGSREPPGLEDDLERPLRRLGPAGLDQLADQAEVAVQDRLDRRHHVDLVGAGERAHRRSRAPPARCRRSRRGNWRRSTSRTGLCASLALAIGRKRGQTQTAATPASSARAQSASTVRAGRRRRRARSARPAAGCGRRPRGSPAPRPPPGADQAGGRIVMRELLEQAASADARASPPRRPPGSGSRSWLSGCCGQPGREIGHDREAQHLEPAMAGADRLRHRRHADQIGAERPKRPDLGRGLEGRPERGEVDARPAARCRAAPATCCRRARSEPS